MYGSIDSSSIIRAFQRHMPDCYVLDHREGGGWINICRGLKTIRSGVDGHDWVVPKHTVFTVPRGDMQASEIYDGVRLVRPGWRVQFKRAAPYLTPAQKSRIERELRVSVFHPAR